MILFYMDWYFDPDIYSLICTYLKKNVSLYDDTKSALEVGWIIFFDFKSLQKLELKYDYDYRIVLDYDDMNNTMKWNKDSNMTEKLTIESYYTIQQSIHTCKSQN